MRTRRIVVACFVILQLVLVSAEPSNAHMLGSSVVNGSSHIGRHPATGDRFFRWFEETGNPSWIAAQRRYATTYFSYHSFWKRQRGVPVPYLDWRLTGNKAGCMNEDYALDFCLGIPGRSGAVAQATWSQDGSQHVVRAGVISRDGFTDRQKESIVCHEVNHILGLDHNSHFSTSARQSCMYPQLTTSPALAYDVHDDVSLRQFYSGHQP